jgi:LacI family transcriptional regulator
MRVTIGDVADRAGVSIATVSRVVNGRYGVASATQTRVQAVIDDLGYESSLIARSLRSQRTNVIGILVADIEPFSAELLKGAAKAVHGSEFELVVYAAGHHNVDGWEQRYLSRLSGTLTDGTILVTPTVTDVFANQPIVAVDPHVGGSTLPTIDSQNFEGAQAMTEHLIALGHRRIAFLAGRPDLESARRREAGYRAALEAAGIAFDADLVRVGGFKEETAAAPVHELLTRSPRPTAVFAANDLSAIQTMRSAAALGLRVPDDVSVAGFDNIPDSALTVPPLTTVDQSIQAQGAAAVQTLLALIDDPGDPGDADPGKPRDAIHITLPTQLVIRSTTAPPIS